ncbi:MAG: hypothetical protein HZB25_00790 [Candidatus Eisenbacteria bacterium]|nr:hypothetical protein [Candidatus Eisenbacteria bacterium]
MAIVWNGRSITEVHVVSASTRPPRLVSRDVESLLKAKGVRVDFKTISVAQLKTASRADAPEPMPDECAAPDPAPPQEPAILSPRLHHFPNSQAAGPGGPALGAPPPPVRLSSYDGEPARLRFESVNVMTFGYRAEAQVEIGYGEQEVLGTATGANSRLGAPRLVASAVLEALKKLINGEAEFALEALEFVEIGGQRLALVAVACLEGRRQRVYYGTAAVEGEPNQAVVAATLDALNRAWGRFRGREKIEYELRPTSIEI